MCCNDPQVTTYSLKFLTISMSNLKIFKSILCYLHELSLKQDHFPKEIEEAPQIFQLSLLLLLLLLPQITTIIITPIIITIIILIITIIITIMEHRPLHLQTCYFRIFIIIRQVGVVVVLGEVVGQLYLVVLGMILTLIIIITLTTTIIISQDLEIIDSVWHHFYQIINQQID